MYPIQIGVLETFQGKFAKYPGPPSCKNATTQFHKQNPEKASKTLGNPCTQLRFDFWGLFTGILLSTLGLPLRNFLIRNLEFSFLQIDYFSLLNWPLSRILRNYRNLSEVLIVK